MHVHDDLFPPGTRDELWLGEAGRRGWIVLTKDRKIRYRTTERTALRSARVRAFVLTAGGLTGSEMANVLVRALPKIERFAAENLPPFIAAIWKGGKIVRID